jgi:DNA repair exonuclease SbcCD ATPase subunit
MQRLSAALLFVGVSAEQSNPLGAVLSLMDDLAAKVKKEGEVEAKAYQDYYEWCDDVSKNTGFAIATAKSQEEKLEAAIAEQKANIEAADTKIGELVESISTDSADLKSATAVREKESADFSASEKELVDVVDTLGRATQILQREMNKNPASFAQMAHGNFAGMVQTLGALVDAAAFSAADKSRLMALVQSNQGTDEDDSELGSPAASTYKGHSGGILDVLGDLQEKAETQLADLRHAEESASHNYAMLKQSLENQLATDNKQMDAKKAGKAASSETLASANGDLEVTLSDLKSGNEALETAQSTCMTVAADHEATVRARAEELKVIATAKGILSETTSGAVSQTYSFIQVGSGIRTSADLARSEVVAIVKQLAQQNHSPALSQLASKISAVMRFGAASGDPFAKVKGLISDMIKKLEADASSDATEKGYCDEELAKTEAKKAELDEDISKLTTNIDQSSARSAGLKAEVKELQSELATLEKEQASAEAYRQEEHANYVQAKSDLEAGLGGVRKALEVLKNYYAAGSSLLEQPAPPMPAAHSAAEGAGTSIIGILETVESDFAVNLAKEETQESDAQSAFEADTQEYKITKTAKTQDVKYKSQEATSLDKSISDLSGDRDTEQTELSAVLEYYGKLKGRCIAKPESYSDRKKRRAAEIAGLKDALNVLENEAALVQRKGRKARHTHFLSSSS